MDIFTRARVFAISLLVVMFCACAESPPEVATAEAEPTGGSSAGEARPERRAGTLPGRVTRIALGDFFALQQSGEVLIYDVRPAFFHSLGHIPDSVSWPKSAYTRQLESREEQIREAVAAGRPVVLYCTDLACPDARDVATRLAARGHDVRVLEGGWEAWKAGGLPGS